jgi:spore maturation protein SpmB
MESQEAIGFSNTSEIPALSETEIPAPTRTSFMASWASVTGATGYLLDVSASHSFDSYIDGYHDLQVGNVTGWVVTGLN